jgi:hypothetical protein
MSELARAIFAAVAEVRYVATYRGGVLELNERAGLADASSSESDKYEELLVNPTLLKLLSQRGDIDCGGLDYVLVRYGHFFQLVTRVPDGHVSIALQPTADLACVQRVLSIVRGEAPP